MIEQKIIWTALPNGLQGDELILTIFVSPRLKTDESANPELQMFPDFEKWPPRLESLIFIVTNNAGFNIELKPDLSELDPTLWTDLFKPDTFVRPFVFSDYKERVLHTYPVRGVMAYLKDIYTQVGEQSPGSLPGLPIAPQPNPALGGLIQTIGPLSTENKRRKLAWVDDLLREVYVMKPGYVYNGFSSKEEQDFYQANRFYKRPEALVGNSPPPHLDPVPPPPQVPEFDFHQAITNLGDHPALLRKLGLIFDLRLPAGEFPADDGGTLIKVIPQWLGDPGPAVFNVDLIPRTRYVFDGEHFRTQERPGGDLEAGLLRLENVNDQYVHDENGYDLVQVDPDGLALKITNFAGNMYSQTSKWDSNLTAIDTPEEGGLPSIQSGGLALVRGGRAFRLHQHFVDTDGLNQLLDSGGDVIFYADDLLRGYRVDICDDESGLWRSLCERVGQYVLPETGRDPIPYADEGYVKSASTSGRDDLSDDLYFHETLFRWSGWSLVAERPGRTIVGKSDAGVHEENIEKVPNTAETPFKLEIDTHAKPLSLPRLRFGRGYQMRVRAVDLAGGGEVLDSAGESQASDLVIYGRYEPLLPPTLVPRAPFTEGESTERMVIRSDYDRNTDEYINSPDVQAAIQGQIYSYENFNDRHVVPPKTSQLMAETHSMFDPFFAPGQQGAGYNIALKEAGTLSDTEIVDVNTGGKDIILPPGTVVVVPGNDPGNLPAGEKPPGEYVIHTSKTLVLPYLPDPIGRGASLRGLPGHEDGQTAPLESVVDPALNLDLLKVPFDLEWPQAQPFRLRIVERSGTIPEGECDEKFESDEAFPIWDQGNRELTVFLPKAEVARIWYSTYPGEDQAGNSDLDQLGIWHWLRQSGKARELQRYLIHGAHWMVSPYRELTLVHAVQRPLCEPQIVKMDAHKKLGETFTTLNGDFLLSVRSTGKLDMEAQWSEWVDDLADAAPKRVSGKSHAFEWAIEEHFDNALKLELNENKRHEFGDTRHRMVDYHLVGTTRFREYFPPQITADPTNITRLGPVKQVSVPNSARPAAPKLVYVLPTYRWRDDRDDPEAPWTNLERIRLGNGLRVYLDRPWFSSGDGELLGVVLWPNPQGGFGELARYVTLMGQDPIRRSNKPHAVLTLDDFANDVHGKATGLSLEEVSGNTFGAAGFPVEFNQQRGLWFADILFNSKRMTSYYPFVRLALARYQPDSINHARLSSVVLDDFIQVAPDRTLRIRFIDEQQFFIQVEGFGTGDRASLRMECEIQIHDDNIPGEFGWVKAPGSKQRPNPVNLPFNPAGLKHHAWRWGGEMTLPARRGELPMRIVVREYERFRADPPEHWAERIVYADQVEVIA